MSWYVMIDCNRIQEYIFSSNRLKGICSASRLLDRLETETIPEMIPTGAELLRSCGGVVLAEFSDEPSAKNFRKEAVAEYRKIGISTTSLVKELPAAGASFYDSVLSPLFIEMQGEKNQPKDLLTSVSTILAVPCEGTGSKPAECVITTPDKEKIRLCRSEAVKLDRTNTRGVITLKGKNTPGKYLDYHGAPEDFGDLVSWGVKSSLEDKTPGTSEGRIMGVVYADVNGLGSLSSEIGAQKNVYAGFAKKLSDVINTALLEAVIEVIDPVYVDRCKKRIPTLCLPLNIFYFGGDDLAFAVAGQYAFDITQKLLEKFEEKTRDLMSVVKLSNGLHGTFPSHLTMSAGIVFAPFNYPIRWINRIGKDLESRAKAAGRATTGSQPSLIDFCVIKNSASGSLSDIRRTMIVKDGITNGQNLYLYGGPYSPSKIDLLTKTAELFGDTEKGVPKGKIKELLSILSMSWQRSETEYKYWTKNRLSEKQYETFVAGLKLFGIPDADKTRPITKNLMTTDVSPIADIVEIMGIVLQKQEA